MHVFYNNYAVRVQVNGNKNIKIYNMVKCGGDGLVMTKNDQKCANL